jgi:hypothetical protein
MADNVTIPASGIGTATPVVATEESGGVHWQKMRNSVVSAQSQLLSSADLAAGVNVDLTAVDITTGKTGQLIACDFGASVPIRIDIQTISGGRTTRATLFAKAGETVPWRTPAPEFITQVGGAGNGFGVSITNLDTSQAANVYATLYWDEVT